MAKTFASWVDGCAVVTGVGTDWQGNPINAPPMPKALNGKGAKYGLVPGRTLFHFSLPTPVLNEDKRATLSKVFVLFSTTTNCTLTVDVFDGPNHLLHFGPVTGNHSTALDSQNSFTVNHDAIGWGVGLDIVATCDADGQEIYFTAAGGDFLHNI